MKRSNRKNSRGARSGAAVVEAALMLPLLIIATFGSIDAAQYINSAQVISNASREGARVCSRNSTSKTDEVEQAVLQYLANAYPQLSESELRQAVQVNVEKNQSHCSEIEGGNLNSIDSGDGLVVKVVFEFQTIRWLAGPVYQNLSTATYCRRE